MTDTRAIAAGIAGGYLLGRTRKAKMALAVVSYVAGRRIGLSPQKVLTQGARKLSASPEFGRLSQQVRGDLWQAGRSMATAAAQRRFDSLADSLQERTRALGESGEPDEPEEPEELEEPEEPEDGETEEEPEEPEEPAERPRPRKKTAKKAAAKKTAPKKAAAKKTAAKKTAARPGRRR